MCAPYKHLCTHLMPVVKLFFKPPAHNADALSQSKPAQKVVCMDDAEIPLASGMRRWPLKGALCAGITVCYEVSSAAVVLEACPILFACMWPWQAPSSAESAAAAAAAASWSLQHATLALLLNTSAGSLPLKALLSSWIKQLQSCVVALPGGMPWGLSIHKAMFGSSCGLPLTLYQSSCSCQNLTSDCAMVFQGHLLWLSSLAQAAVFCRSANICIPAHFYLDHPGCGVCSDSYAA